MDSCTANRIPGMGLSWCTSHANCQIYFPPDQPPHTGIDGAKAAFADLIQIRPKIKSEIISEVIVGDIALLRARWSAVAPDGTVIGEGESTEVARKLENGGWGYLIDCPLGPPEIAS